VRITTLKKDKGWLVSMDAANGKNPDPRQRSWTICAGWSADRGVGGNLAALIKL
jgi:hypothetical protein